jgi:hypothetical protein
MEPAAKSEVYLIYSEWGPALRTPRDERLAECFPAISEAERETCIREFEQVESEVWKVAKEGGQSRHTREAFDLRMSGCFPWISKAALERAWFLACYYAWHEGYDTQKV